MKVKIGIIQAAFQGTTDKTLTFYKRSVEKLCSTNGTQIICFKELFHTPYFCTEMNVRNFDLAISRTSKVFKSFQEIACKHKCVLILPFFEKRQEGLYHNSACIIDADGSILGYYRKNHIPDDPCFYEKFYFKEGDLGFPVFKTKYGKISVLICWDQWFPESARIVSLNGAQIIFYPTAIGTLQDEQKELEQFSEAWETVQVASAIQNGNYAVSVNRIGKEQGTEFWGRSFVAGPFGEKVYQSLNDQEEITTCSIDLKKIEEVRQVWPFLRDRRIDSYKDILKSGI